MCWRRCLRCDVLWCLRFYLGQRKADEGKIHHQLHPVPLLTLGVFPCSMIGLAAMTIFAPTTTTISRFTLKDKCRSEKWEVYLYGDMTIKVMGSRRAENCGVLRSCSSWRDGKAFFWAVYTGTRPGGPPPSGRGRGGGDAGSLLPGVLPPN